MFAAESTGIRLQVGAVAVMPRDRAIEQPERDFLLLTETESMTKQALRDGLHAFLARTQRRRNPIKVKKVPAKTPAAKTAPIACIGLCLTVCFASSIASSAA